MHRCCRFNLAVNPFFRKSDNWYDLLFLIMIRVVNINNHVNNLRDVLHRSVDEHYFNSHEECRNMLLHLPKAYQGSEIDSESDYKDNENEFEFNRNKNESNNRTPNNLHDSNRTNAPRYSDGRYGQSTAAGRNSPTHRSQKQNERKFSDMFWISHFENMDWMLIIYFKMIFNFT